MKFFQIHLMYCHPLLHQQQEDTDILQEHLKYQNNHFSLN